MSLYTEAIVLGMTAGFIARLYMLRTDYRNYPSYPHGYIIHLSLGAIAASLAAIALPALLEEEYTAVTFLVLCAQQFRDIRNMERETLMKLEEHTLDLAAMITLKALPKCLNPAIIWLCWWR